MIEFCTYTRNRAALPELPAKLEVQIQMFGEWGVGPKGEKLITPWLISNSEVDHYIDRVISELEKVRSEAKARLEENDG